MALSPVGIRYAVWRQSSKRAYPIHLVRGATPIKEKSIERRNLEYARNMIRQVLDRSDLRPLYPGEKIDRAFNAGILRSFCAGKYYTAKAAPVRALDTLTKWADLLSNKVGGAIGFLTILEESSENGSVPPDLLAEILPELQASLRELKIIEDWIHYHRDFMRRIIA